MRELRDLAGTVRRRQKAAEYYKPLPDRHQEPYADPFWEGAREHRLLFQACQQCGTRQYFPRPWCVQCGSEDVDWVESDGTGTVASYTVIRRVVTAPAFSDEVPYATVYVDLDDGPRFFSMLVDCPVEDVEIGMPVEVVFDDVTGEITLPKFRPR